MQLFAKYFAYVNKISREPPQYWGIINKTGVTYENWYPKRN